MADDGEFCVALSFAQMAAILTQESLTPAEIMSNRIFGSLRLVGGIVELAGSGVLCAVPEPTMITKIGCVAMGVHASDQLSAGATQLLTGKETDSFAFKAGSSAAEALGTSKSAGQVIGLATEFAVPLSTASLYNAFRVSSVRAGRISIVTSEKLPNVPGNLGGGHALRKHVGKDIDYLTKRFASKKVNVPSTFYGIDTAEWAVSKVLQNSRLKILMFSKAKFLLRNNTSRDFKMNLGKNIGWGVAREAPSKVVHMSKVNLTIRFVEYNHMPYYIVTAHPIL